MNWLQQCAQEADRLSREQQQTVLDDVRGGLTLGEVKLKNNTTLEAVCGVVNRSIGTHSFLKEKIP